MYLPPMIKNEIAKAKVTKQMQIIIPKKVQDKLGGLAGGQFIVFLEENERIYIQKGEVTLL